ncbi:MAG: DUF3035 domain-containing protein [Alphaproteobacteria bacterium]|nr:DUF3035 domain-containing protein [Alphaproteobacteria bacterium]
MSNRSIKSPDVAPVRSPRTTLVLLAVAALTLAACGDSTKRALGIERTPPDEFAVVPRAPLSQPPNFNLRPPRPGAEDLTTLSTREQARQAVFRRDGEAVPAGETAPAEGGRLRFGGPAVQAAPQTQVNRTTPGESAFLSRAGALETDPLIRTQVDRETRQIADENQNFVRKLLGLRQDEQGEVVDAPAEARRLREAQALGDSPADGATPTIERTNNSLFRIF